ncbi:calcium-binding protein [Streptomyces sp. NPDC026673]|uniref:calcium-binding protein n=1 Tax=Streptomyces sp. NPDC026673 TaxID=3155724 RepID=UPI0033F59B5C
MRIRATVAAVTGALALASLAVPAAQASDKPAASALSTFAAKAGADEVVGDTKITKVVVNGGKDIVLGTTATKTVSLSVTATDPSGIEDVFAILWHGTDLESPDGVDGGVVPNEDTATCTVSATDPAVSTCKLTFTFDPAMDLYKNELAGTWKVAVGALAKDEDGVVKDAAATTKVKRNARLVTFNASPEPVKKGKPITVTGKLERANWATGKYAGYTSQSVQLQFRKKGTSTYKTVKTVKSSSTGALKTTVTASTDGYWRYNFVGTSTTGTAVSTSDFVDVK